MGAEIFGALFAMLLCAAGITAAAYLLPLGDDDLDSAQTDDDKPPVQPFAVLQARLDRELSGDHHPAARTRRRPKPSDERKTLAAKGNRTAAPGRHRRQKAR